MTKINCRTTLRGHSTFFLLKCILYCRSKIVCSNYSEWTTKERMGVPAPSAGEAIMTLAQYGYGMQVAFVKPTARLLIHIYNATLDAVFLLFTWIHLKFCNSNRCLKIITWHSLISIYRVVKIKLFILIHVNVDTYSITRYLWYSDINYRQWK